MLQGAGLLKQGTPNADPSSSPLLRSWGSPRCRAALLQAHAASKHEVRKPAQPCRNREPRGSTATAPATHSLQTPPRQPAPSWLSSTAAKPQSQPPVPRPRADEYRQAPQPMPNCTPPSQGRLHPTHSHSAIHGSNPCWHSLAPQLSSRKQRGASKGHHGSCHTGWQESSPNLPVRVCETGWEAPGPVKSLFRPPAGKSRHLSWSFGTSSGPEGRRVSTRPRTCQLAATPPFQGTGGA